MQLKSIIELIGENKTDFFSYLNVVVSAQEKLCVKGDHFKFLMLFKRKLKAISYNIVTEIVKHISESVTLDNIVYLEIREVIGRSYHYSFNVEMYNYEEVYLLRNIL